MGLAGDNPHPMHTIAYYIHAFLWPSRPPAVTCGEMPYRTVRYGNPPTGPTFVLPLPDASDYPSRPSVPRPAEAAPAPDPDPYAEIQEEAKALPPAPPSPPAVIISDAFLAEIAKSQRLADLIMQGFDNVNQANGLPPLLEETGGVPAAWRCEACGQPAETKHFRDDADSWVCPACNAAMDDYYAHQYSPRNTGVVDCPLCGHPNSSDDWVHAVANGRPVWLCKECNHALELPAGLVVPPRD